METLNTAISRLLVTPDEAPSLFRVETWLKEYPYFILPAVMLLKREPSTLSPAERSRLLSAVALNAPDPQTLMALLRKEAATADDDFYPPAVKARPATDEAIDTFLDRFGHSDPKEMALLEKLIFNPTPDYSALLAREEESSLPPAPGAEGETSQQALIDAFIRRERAPEPEPEPEPAPVAITDSPRHVSSAADDSSLSESLAKIYIRRKRYDKAFEIIHTLSLKNPKKSVYFADQLRFLRKLMLNRGITVPGEAPDSAKHS